MMYFSSKLTAVRQETAKSQNSCCQSRDVLTEESAHITQSISATEKIGQDMTPPLFILCDGTSAVKAAAVYTMGSTNRRTYAYFKRSFITGSTTRKKKQSAASSTIQHTTKGAQRRKKSAGDQYRRTYEMHENVSVFLASPSSHFYPLRMGKLVNILSCSDRFGPFTCASLRCECGVSTSLKSGHEREAPIYSNILEAPQATRPKS